MTLPTLVANHVHVSEREVAHTWPDGQKDNAAWEDCAWCSAVEFARLTIDARIAATHAEAELLRDASGEPPTGGSTAWNVESGILKRYHVDVAAPVRGFSALWTALKPGYAAVASGSMGSVSTTLRRWDPGFGGGHSTLVVRIDTQDRVWWCDPLAPKGTYEGQWVTKAELKRFVDGLPGAGQLVRKVMVPVVPPTPPPPPVVTDMPALTTYTPGSIATIKATANIRTAPDLTAAGIVRVSKGETAAVIGTCKGAVDPQGGSDQWYLWWDGTRYLYTAKGNVTSLKAPVQDCTTVVASAVAAQKAADAQALTAAVNAAVAPLKQKIAVALSALG